jgi:hypothetical protein
LPRKRSFCRPSRRCGSLPLTNSCERGGSVPRTSSSGRTTEASRTNWQRWKGKTQDNITPLALREIRACRAGEFLARLRDCSTAGFAPSGGFPRDHHGGGGTCEPLSFLEPVQPSRPTTRILTIGTVNPGADPAAVRSILPTEVRETVKLYLDGKIDQWFSLQDRNGVALKYVHSWGRGCE